MIHRRPHDILRMVFSDLAASSTHHPEHLSSPVFSERISFGPAEQPALLMIGSSGQRRLELASTPPAHRLGEAWRVQLETNRMTIQPLETSRARSEYQNGALQRPKKTPPFTKFSVLRNRTQAEHREVGASKLENVLGQVPPLILAFGPNASPYFNYDAVLIFLLKKRWYELMDAAPGYTIP